MFLLFSSFVFSNEVEGIFSRNFNKNNIIIHSSGSALQRINGTKQLTKPEYSIYPFTKNYDWCSNIVSEYDHPPWITYSIRNKKFKFDSYFVRCSCYYNSCCCSGETHSCFDCCLYSWSLQISDDNITWNEIHKIEKDSSMRRCNEKKYDLDKTYTAKYVRIIQNHPCPGNPMCIAINRFELFGETVDDADLQQDFVSFHDDDEDISIIGHISKNFR